MWIIGVDLHKKVAGLVLLPARGGVSHEGQVEVKCQDRRDRLAVSVIATPATATVLVLVVDWVVLVLVALATVAMAKVDRRMVLTLPLPPFA